MSLPNLVEIAENLDSSAWKPMNWAYMVIASLAWYLKVWSGLMIKPSGTEDQRIEQKAIKERVIGMDFRTFRDRILMVPAQIIRRSRSLVWRTSPASRDVEFSFRLSVSIRSC